MPRSSRGNCEFGRLAKAAIVVGEQCEREDPPAMLFRAHLEQFDPLFSARIVSHDLLPGDAAAGHTGQIALAYSTRWGLATTEAQHLRPTSSTKVWPHLPLAVARPASLVLFRLVSPELRHKNATEIVEQVQAAKLIKMNEGAGIADGKRPWLSPRHGAPTRCLP